MGMYYLRIRKIETLITQVSVVHVELGIIKVFEVRQYEGIVCLPSFEVTVSTLEHGKWLAKGYELAFSIFSNELLIGE